MVSQNPSSLLDGHYLSPPSSLIYLLINSITIGFNGEHSATSFVHTVMERSQVVASLEIFGITHIIISILCVMYVPSFRLTLQYFNFFHIGFHIALFASALYLHSTCVELYHRSRSPSTHVLLLSRR